MILCTLHQTEAEILIHLHLFNGLSLIGCKKKIASVKKHHLGTVIRTRNNTSIQGCFRNTGLHIENFNRLSVMGIGQKLRSVFQKIKLGRDCSSVIQFFFYNLLIFPD